MFMLAYPFLGEDPVPSGALSGLSGQLNCLLLACYVRRARRDNCASTNLRGFMLQRRLVTWTDRSINDATTG